MYGNRFGGGVPSQVQDPFIIGSGGPEIGADGQSIELWQSGQTQYTEGVVESLKFLDLIKEKAGFTIDPDSDITKTGDITDGGGGNLNIYSVAHGLSTFDEINLYSAVYGNLTYQTVTKVDDDNFTIVKAYISDETAQRWTYREHLVLKRNGIVCLKLYQGEEGGKIRFQNTGPQIGWQSDSTVEILTGAHGFVPGNAYMAAAIASLILANGFTANAVSLRHAITGWSSFIDFQNGFGQQIAKISDRGKFQLGIDGIAYGEGVTRWTPAAVQVTDAIETDLATIALAEGDYYNLIVDCVAQKTDETLVAQWCLQVSVQRQTAGSAVLKGNITHLIDESANPAAWSFSLAVDGNNLDIRGKGEANVNFKLDVKFKNVATS